MERAKRSRYNWTEEKKVALLTQIVATGNVGFLTAKDAKVGEEFVSQLDVWTNAEHGIIPILNMHAPEFKHNPIKSTYTSVITSVRGWVPVRRGGLSEADSHLYTQGKEQKEPIEVDDATNTYNTKYEVGGKARGLDRRRTHPHARGSGRNGLAKGRAGGRVVRARRAGCGSQSCIQDFVTGGA
mmetsp:Transcript_2575/g.7455  ORF Transcript_2575/g.7455 Transcript_2575/m.7455 type:complete len:184 (-) Transcript_2575:383-934(-)